MMFSNEPIFVQEGFQDVKCGGSHSIALSSKGQVFTWGSECLAQDDRTICYEPKHALFCVSTPPNIKAISCGTDSVAVITKQG